MTRTCSFMHTARAGILIRAVQGPLVGGRLTLTDVGRSLPGTAHATHQSKRIDRLLGNRHLAAEREARYRFLKTLAVILPAHGRPMTIATGPGNRRAAAPSEERLGDAARRDEVEQSSTPLLAAVIGKRPCRRFLRRKRL